ncbi:MAG: hypothetical protein KH135_04895 [Firmicutes bacterium]|nr:hypothetical protein [Bacillota bacterium]
MNKDLKKMRSKKSFIILGIVFVLYLLVVFVFIPLGNKDKENEYITYLIVGSNVKWQYEDGKWDVMKDTAKKIGFNRYECYTNQQYLGNYSLSFYQGKWYLFDRNNDSVDYEGILFAYYSKSNMKVYQDEVEPIDNEGQAYLTDYLEENGISLHNYANLNVNKMYHTDVDGDGEKEKLYVASNFRNSDIKDKAFSIIFYENNGKIQVVKERFESKEASMILPYYDIIALFDFKDDGKYEFIVEDVPFSRGEPKFTLYQLEGKKYIPIMQD